MQPGDDTATVCRGILRSALLLATIAAKNSAPRRRLASMVVALSVKYFLAGKSKTPAHCGNLFFIVHGSQQFM